MAFTSNIPQATDRPNNSQSLLLNNFGAINTVVAINHVTFDDPSGDQGKHKWVTMPVQAASPPVGAFAAGETGFYSFNDTTTLKNEIHTNVTHQATVRQIPASASFLSISSAPGNSSEGWTYLPSGILMRWGQSTGNSVTTVTYTTGAGVAPAFNEVFSIQLTPTASGTADVDYAVRIIDFNAAQFRWYSSKRTTAGAETTNRNINWLAIGY